jgi:hypothetical protein
VTDHLHPLEQRLISELPGELERAVRPFDAAAIAHDATVRGGPSVLRVTAVTAVVAAAAIATVVAIEGLALFGALPGGPPPPSSTPSEPRPSADADRLAAIQRADGIISTTLTPEENAAVVIGHTAAVESCMRQLGWDFEFGTATPEEAAGITTTLTELEQWTFSDVASARASGYGLQERLAGVHAFVAGLEPHEGEVRIPDQATMNPVDAERFEVEYFGTEDERIEILERDGSHSGMPGGGCLGAAHRELYGDIAREMWLRDARGTAESDIWVAVESDGAVQAAWTSWQACIGERGFAFENPNAAFETALRATFAGDHVQERAIATAHAECAVESNLDVAVTAAFFAASQAVLPGLEQDLIALQRLEEEAAVRGREILGLDD